MRRHIVSAAGEIGSVAEASRRKLSRATMPAMPDAAETHTWGPRPAILNDLSRDEETETMGYNWRRSGGRRSRRADQADVGGGGGGSNKRKVWQDADAPGKVSVPVAGQFGVPGGVWPLQLFCRKKPPQRPTAWGGSVHGSAACDWLHPPSWQKLSSLR